MRLGKESQCLHNFFNALVGVFNIMEKSIFSICDAFGNTIKSSVQDDKLCDFYQLLLNYSLTFAEDIQKKYHEVQILAAQINHFEKEFIAKTAGAKSVIRSEQKRLSLRSSEFCAHFNFPSKV